MVYGKVLLGLMNERTNRGSSRLARSYRLVASREIEEGRSVLRYPAPAGPPVAAEMKVVARSALSDVGSVRHLLELGQARYTAR
jgi:hypothetical protein